MPVFTGYMISELSFECAKISSIMSSVRRKSVKNHKNVMKFKIHEALILTWILHGSSMNHGPWVLSYTSPYTRPCM